MTYLTTDVYKILEMLILSANWVTNVDLPIHLVPHTKIKKGFRIW